MSENRVVISHPTYLKAISTIISYIFHPLFLPTYVFLWLLLRLPFEFAGITPFGLFARKITVFLMTAFFPAFAVFLLWRLKFIDNIYLRTQRERIVPYIITMIFYWWMWYLSVNFTDQPFVLRFFFLGIFFATILGLIFNNFFKISIHAMGLGGLLTFVLLTCFFYHVYLGSDIALVILFTGLVCTARFIVSNHTNFEVYFGLLTGSMCQIIAYSFSL